MRDLPASLSVLARYTLCALQDAASSGDGKTLDPASLDPYFPPAHQPLVRLALEELAGCGLVTLTPSGRIQKLAGVDLDAEFDQWWSDYPGPRRIKKQKVKQKYQRHRRNGVSRDQMFEGLARWRNCKDWLKDDGVFIMAPEVWLNGSCWDDHPEAGRQAARASVLPLEFQARPWLGVYVKHVEDPAKPKAWEVANFAAALGLGQEAEQAAWLLKTQGPLAAAEWAWSRRAQ